MAKKLTPKSAKKVAPKPAKKMNKKINKPTPKAKMAKAKTAKKSAPAKKADTKKAAPKSAAAKKSVLMKTVVAKTVPEKGTANKAAAKTDYTKILTPLDDRILVEPMAAEKKSKSGLILIDSTPDSYVRARVLAVGRGKRNKFGKIRPLDVQTGDNVLYAPRIGNEIKVSGQDLFIIRESDVLGVIEE